MSSENGKNNIVSPPPSAGEFVKNKPFLYFSPKDNVRGIIEKMRENHIYAAAVTENGRLAGILTGHDILVHAAAWHARPAPSMENIAHAFNVMRAADALIQNPVAVETHTLLDDALRIMTENCFHYVPVIENDRPVGILNIVDVARFLEEKSRRDNESRDTILAYIMGHEDYGCVSRS